VSEKGVYKAALGQDSGDVLIVDMLTGNMSHLLRAHYRPVSCIALNWKLKRALSVAEDLAVIYWDLDSGECLRSLVENCIVTDIAADFDNNLAVLVTKANTIKTVCLENCNVQSVCNGQQSMVDSFFGLSVDFEAKKAVVGCREKHQLQIWDLATGSCVKELDVSDSIQAIATDAHKESAVVGFRNGAISITNISQGEIRTLTKNHDCKAEFLSADFSQQKAFSANSRGECIVWDMANRTQVARFLAPCSIGHIAIDFVRSNAWFYGKDSSLHLYMNFDDVDRCQQTFLNNIGDSSCFVHNF